MHSVADLLLGGERLVKLFCNGVRRYWPSDADIYVYCERRTCVWPDSAVQMHCRPAVNLSTVHSCMQ